jgi:hypothetical protein
MPVLKQDGELLKLPVRNTQPHFVNLRRRPRLLRGQKVTVLLNNAKQLLRSVRQRKMLARLRRRRTR